MNQVSPERHGKMVTKVSTEQTSKPVTIIQDALFGGVESRLSFPNTTEVEKKERNE